MQALSALEAIPSMAAALEALAGPPNCLVTTRRLVGSPEVLLLSCLDEFVVVTPDSVIFGGRIRFLPSPVVKTCMAGGLVAVLLRTGELMLLDKDGESVAVRAVAVPAEIGKDVFLCAAKAGDYIGVGLSNDFIVYRKSLDGGKVSLSVKTTLRFALRPQHLQLFTDRDDCLIWSLSRHSQPLVRLEGPGGADAKVYSLPTSRQVLSVVSMGTQDGGSLLVYKDGFNYINNERIQQGQSLPFHAMPGITCSSSGNGDAYVVARGELFRVRVRDGHFDVESVCMLEKATSAALKMSLFFAEKKDGKYTVDWAGAGRRGRITVDINARNIASTLSTPSDTLNNDAKDASNGPSNGPSNDGIVNYEGVDYACRDFQVATNIDGYSLVTLSASPTPTALREILRSVHANMLADLGSMGHTVDIFWACHHLFLVNPEMTLVYAFRGGQCHYVRELPKCLAAGEYDGMIVTVQRDGIVAYDKDICEIRRHAMECGSGHVAFGQVATNGDGVWISHGLEAPQQVLAIDPSPTGEWISYTRVIDADTMVVGSNQGLKFYNTHTRELLRRETQTSSDYFLAPWGPVIAASRGLVLSNGQRHFAGSLPVYFAGMVGDYVVAHGNGVWLIGREEVRLVRPPEKYAGMATQSALWAAVGVFDIPNSLIVSYPQSVVSMLPEIDPGLSVMNTTPRIYHQELSHQPSRSLQVPTIRSMLVVVGRHFEAFDLKDNGPLDMDSDLPKTTITAMAIWNIEVGGARYEYLAVGTTESDKHFIRLLDVRRKKNKVTLKKRSKIAVTKRVACLVDSGDLYYAAGNAVTALGLQVPETGRSPKIEAGRTSTYPGTVTDLEPSTDCLFVATRAGVYATSKKTMKIINPTDDVTNRARDCTCMKLVMLGAQRLLLLGDQTDYITILQLADPNLKLVEKVPLLSRVKRLRFCQARDQAVAVVALLENSSFIECTLSQQEEYGTPCFL